MYTEKDLTFREQADSSRHSPFDAPAGQSPPRTLHAIHVSARILVGSTEDYGRED